MAFLVQVRDRRGGRLAGFVFLLHEYEFPDGTRLRMLTDVGWCRDCRDFAMLERLPTVEGLEREAAEWFFARYPEERTTRMQPMMEEALRARQRDRVEQYRLLLNYLSHRASPPRCLTCGGSVYIRYADWNRWYDHPVGAGQFEVVCIGHADVSSAPLVYDPDGMRMKR